MKANRKPTKRSSALPSSSTRLLTFTCFRTPIVDVSGEKHKTLGMFTGTLTTAGDMERVIEITGVASFFRKRDAERVEMRKLFTDLRANTTGVWCLFHDPNWKPEE